MDAGLEVRMRTLYLPRRLEPYLKLAPALIGMEYIQAKAI